MTTKKFITYHKLFSVSILLNVIIVISACISNSKEHENNAPKSSGHISLNADSIIVEALTVEPLIINYKNDTLLKNRENFQLAYTTNQKKIILAINRINESQLRMGRILVIPDTFLTDLMLYAPFPDSLPEIVDLNKLIIISQRVQAIGLYENGKLIRWGPVSTGKKSTPTPNRLYYINFKARLKISTINNNWIMPWYCNIENRSGIALHEYVLPGFPASHGCIRLFEKDAIFIYNWSESWVLNPSGRIVKYGTPVIIFGQYDFKGLPPWQKLTDNFNEVMYTEDEMIELQNYLDQLNIQTLRSSRD